MNKISTFISAHFAWLSTIFLIVGIGFAALAIFLFFYFHIAGIMKTWLYHHGIWKKRENKESHNRTLANNRDQEDYQQEISRLFASSDHSDNLEQKPPIADIHEPEIAGIRESADQNSRTQESSDPNGTNATELLKPNDSHVSLRRIEDVSSDEAPDTTPSLVHKNSESIFSADEAAKKDSQDSSHSDAYTSDTDTHDEYTELQDTNDAETTTLLKKSNDSEGAETTLLLNKTDASNGSEPTAVLLKDTEKQVPVENEQEPSGSVSKQKDPVVDFSSDTTNPDFKITKKEILIHTDESI